MPSSFRARAALSGLVELWTRRRKAGLRVLVARPASAEALEAEGVR